MDAGRILTDEKPADLLVQQPTKFELVISLSLRAQRTNVTVCVQGGVAAVLANNLMIIGELLIKRSRRGRKAN